MLVLAMFHFNFDFQEELIVFKRRLIKKKKDQFADGQIKRTYSELSHAIELAAFDPDGYNLECKRYLVLLP